MFLTCQEDIGNFYNPTTKEDFQLRKEQLLSREDILNNSAQLDSLLILSDSTWKRLSDATDYSFKWDYYLFRGEGLKNSSSFQNDLLNKIIDLSHGKMLMNPDQQAVKDKMDDYQDEILDYEGNELEAARSWQCYPYARETQIAIQKEIGAIYLLLIFFIALISFTSATMIIALKITGTIPQSGLSWVAGKGIKQTDRKADGTGFLFPFHLWLYGGFVHDKQIFVCFVHYPLQGGDMGSSPTFFCVFFDSGYCFLCSEEKTDRKNDESCRDVNGLMKEIQCTACYKFE